MKREVYAWLRSHKVNYFKARRIVNKLFNGNAYILREREML